MEMSIQFAKEFAIFSLIVRLRRILSFDTVDFADLTRIFREIGENLRIFG
jgi:hypothetical protein